MLDPWHLPPEHLWRLSAISVEELRSSFEEQKNDTWTLCDIIWSDPHLLSVHTGNWWLETAVAVFLGELLLWSFFLASHIPVPFHYISPSAWLIPSRTEYFLCMVVNLPGLRASSFLKGYFSFLSDRSHLQRLKACLPFAISLSLPPFLERDPNCLDYLSQHWCSQVTICWLRWWLRCSCTCSPMVWGQVVTASFVSSTCFFSCSCHCPA